MEEYKKRIVKTIQYIDNHIDSDLSLEKVSEISAYSPFHFHRIFKLATGETLQSYIIRKKIEKSALHLAMHKNMEIKEIYWNLGFSNHSAFCKTFKKYYGVPPTEFRRSAPEKFHKILQTHSKNGQIDTVFSQYICNIENLLNWTNMNLKIEVKEMPEMNLASVMSLGIANVESSFNVLIDWAIKKNLFPRENVKMIAVYHDSCKITPLDKVRIHACMLLDVQATPAALRWRHLIRRSGNDRSNVPPPSVVRLLAYFGASCLL